MGTQTMATAAAGSRKALEVVIKAEMAVLRDAPAVVVPAAALAAKAVAATAEGAARAPMATAMAIVKRVEGFVRARTPSMVAEILSRHMSRPRARRCLAASSVMPSVSATARTDWPSR